MLPVKQCVSQFMSQSRYTLGSCTIRIDADIFAVQQDGIVTQKVVAKRMSFNLIARCEMISSGFRVL